MTETAERPQLDAKDIYSPPFTGRAYYDDPTPEEDYV